MRTFNPERSDGTCAMQAHRRSKRKGSAENPPQKVLDNRINFIKLKINEKTPRFPGERGSAAKQVIFQDGSPIAFAIEEPKNHNSVGGLMNLVKQKIILHRDEMNLMND